MHPCAYAHLAGMCEPAPAGRGAGAGPVEGSEGECKPMAPGAESPEVQRGAGGAAAAYGVRGLEPTSGDVDGLGLLAGYESGSEGSG